MINIIIFWLVFLIFLVADLFGQPPGPVATIDAKAAAEVLQLEELGRKKALRADTEWGDLMAEGAYMIGPDGNVAVFEAAKGFPPFPLRSFTLSELIARPHTEVVVVTGLAEIEAIAPDKRIIPFKMRFMNVWKRWPDGWRLIVTQRTAVTPPKAGKKPADR
jgi:hypothetical protein